MKTFLDCVPCFVDQTINATRMCTLDEAVVEAVLREVLGALGAMDMTRTPPEMARDIHAVIAAHTGDQDAYRAVKDEYNGKALALYSLRARVADAADPLATAVRLAIAGNVIDFGIAGHGMEIGLEQTIEDALTQPLAIDDLDDLREPVAKARRILYIADNAGEVAFDRVLIEYLGPERVTLVVKARPILNDATREDARVVGLTDIVEVIDAGMDLPGTLLHEAPVAFQRRFAAADLVLSKGQGNYETLSESRHPALFFLLKAKCAVIARDLGCAAGRFVVKAHGSRSKPGTA